MTMSTKAVHQARQKQTVLALAAGLASLALPRVMAQQQAVDPPANVRQGYIVTDANWRQLEHAYRAKFPAAVRVFCDGTLKARADHSYGTPPEPSEQVKKEGLDTIRQFFARPVGMKQYDILNMFGVWIKKARSCANSGSFMAAFSGTFFQTTHFTFIIPVMDETGDNLVGMGKLYYVRPDEFGSTDPAVTALKVACIDFIEDCMTSKTSREKLKDLLPGILTQEKDKMVLARLTALTCKYGIEPKKTDQQTKK